MTTGHHGGIQGDTQVELPPVLTVDEVAAYLRVGRTMAYELVREDNFPVIRYGRSGRCIRIPTASFLNWAKRGRPPERPPKR